MKKEIKSPLEGAKRNDERNFSPPEKIYLSFEELRNSYLSTSSEKEKRTILRQMSKKAVSFEDWLFVFGHARERNIRYMSEKKLVKTASTVSEIVLLVTNYNMTRKAVIAAIDKALTIAHNGKEFGNLKQICGNVGMMIEYSREETKRALIEALS